MMDNELFELCKEVYEKTGWDDTETIIRVGDDKHQQYISRNLYVTGDDDRYGYTTTPLYTSDYLADKLRNYDWTITNLNSKQFSLQSDSLSEPDAAILGETLTVVLLKLTLALHEEGAFNE